MRLETAYFYYLSFMLIMSEVLSKMYILTTKVQTNM